MNKQTIVVSALIERTHAHERQVLIQTRNKPKISPTYTGMIEIPAGGVVSYEKVFSALKREVKEETGLDIIKIFGEEDSAVEENRKGDISMVFTPYLCQQMIHSNGGLPWYGFVFRCEVKGKISRSSEACDHRWLTIRELRDYVNNFPEKIFPLQYAVLKKYVSEH